MAKRWDETRSAIIGFVLGAVFTGTKFLFSPASILSSHTPIAMAIFGGLMGMVVFGAAAISRNRFAGSMSKFTE
jgi:hypothetical protein